MTMQVKLLRHTPEPERTVAMSARLCYSPIGAAQLEEKISDEQAAKLVRKLVTMGHFSTLEHVTFTFAIEGVSGADPSAGPSPYCFLLTAISALCEGACL